MDPEAGVFETIILLPGKSYPRACSGKKTAAERISLGPGGNHVPLVIMCFARSVLCRGGVLLPGENIRPGKELWRQDGSWQVEASDQAAGRLACAGLVR